jgi:hypothetical protein
MIDLCYPDFQPDPLAQHYLSNLYLLNLLLERRILLVQNNN